MNLVNAPLARRYFSCIVLSLKRGIALGFCGCLLISSPLLAANKPRQDPVKSKVDKPKEVITPFQEALISAYKTNSDLRAKLHALYGQFEARPRALAGFRPNISAKLSQHSTKTHDQNYTNKVPPYATGTANYYSRQPSAAVTVSQDLFSGGQTLAQVAQADEQIQEARYDYLSAEQSTLLDAIKAYLDVVLNRAILEHTKANEKYMEKSLEEQQVRLEVGEATITEVAQSQTYLAQARAKLAAALGALESAYATYERVIGIKAGTLTLPKMLEHLPKTRQELINAVQKRSPFYLKSLHTEKRAKHATAEQQGKFLPTITANASASRALSKGTTGYVAPGRQNTYQATINMNIPLYQQGAEWSHLRQSYQDQAQARFSALQALKVAIEKAIQHWEGWEAAKRQMEQFEIQINSAEVARDSAVLTLEVGEGTYLPILDAQTKLLEAQQGLEQARHDTFLAGYQILGDMGLLTTKDLALPVERYDVDGYYEQIKGALFGLGPDAGA